MTNFDSVDRTDPRCPAQKNCSELAGTIFGAHTPHIPGRSVGNGEDVLPHLSIDQQGLIQSINRGLLQQDLRSLSAAVNSGASSEQLFNMVVTDIYQMQRLDSQLTRLFALGSVNAVDQPRLSLPNVTVDNFRSPRSHATIDQPPPSTVPIEQSRSVDQPVAPIDQSRSLRSNAAIDPPPARDLAPEAQLKSPPDQSDRVPPVQANTGNFQVALINDMVQVPMTGPLPDVQQNTVYSGKNDVQSVQLGIHAADGSKLSNVNVSVSDLTASNGAKIDAKNIELYREHYVNVTKSSNNWQKANPANPAGPTGWYADGLIPFIDPATGKPGSNPKPGLEGNHFSVSPGQNQPVWLDVKVHKDAQPGDYNATITVDSDQGKVQVPLKVHVWNFEAPTKSYIATSFNAIGKNDTAVQETLLANKISPVFSDPAKEQEYLAAGLTARGVGSYSGADYGHPVMGPPPDVASLVASKNAGNPVKDPNLLIYDYSADEIGGHPNLYPQLQAWGRNLHAAGVNQLVTMAPDQALLSDGTGSGKPAVDIFSMLPVQFDKASPDLMNQFRQRGAQMWSYNTLIQDDYSPKWEIDFSPLNERQQAGFISQSNGLTGLLGWAATNWSADPWNSPYKQFQAGEGALVLPGDAAGLQGDAPTIRLKALRDGVSDYNYVQMLRNNGNSVFADRIAHSVGLNFHTWSRDPREVEKAHELLGAEIEREQATRPTT
jgi:hypothetical protein